MLVDEATPTTAPDAGSEYRWDAEAMQYVHNYGTPRSGAGCHSRLFAQLDDGETYFADFALANRPLTRKTTARARPFASAWPGLRLRPRLGRRATPPLLK